MHASDKLTKEQWENLPITDDNFDKSYYEEGGHCGFKVPYDWENMRVHVEKKVDFIEKIYRLLNWNSILFCGCAKGFEVKEARRRGYDAKGIDISQYAIDNVDPKAKGYVTLGDVADIPFPDNSFDIVAVFDVLHILPEGSLGYEKRERAYKEVQRVAKKGVVIRTTAKWREGKEGYYQDGNPLTLWTPDQIIRGIEWHDKHTFFFTMLSNRFEISWFFFARKDEEKLLWRDYYV